MSNVDVRCEYKKCGEIVTMEKKELRNGFTCPHCGHDEYKILI